MSVHTESTTGTLDDVDLYDLFVEEIPAAQLNSSVDLVTALSLSSLCLPSIGNCLCCGPCNS